MGDRVPVSSTIAQKRELREELLFKPFYDEPNLPKFPLPSNGQRIPFENPEDAVFMRSVKRAVMAYSTVDWEKIPNSEERRLGSNPEKRPEKLTIKFR